MSSADQNSYSKSGMVTFVLSMIASFAILIYVSFFNGIDLKEVKEQAPGTEMAPQAGGPAKKFDAASVKEPWVSSEEIVAHGKELYTANCVVCHGAGGLGDGPAGASLNPKPRNLVEGKWKKGGGRLGLMDVMNNGLPGTPMQAYKHLPLVDRWALVHYVRSISQNPGKDDDAAVAAKAKTIQ